MTQDSTLEELLRQGAAATRVGETEVAREYFARATELDPTSIQAWLGLSGVVDGLADKQAYLMRVLALDPDNAEAQTTLDWLQRKEESSSARFKENVGGAPESDTPETERAVITCAYHPTVETLLRCNRCGKPICPRCAVLTEVGYRCPECIRNQQSLFFNARLSDYPVAVVVAGTAAGLAALLLVQTGFLIALFVSVAVGGLIAEFVSRVLGRRRGRYIWIAASGAIIGGGLLGFIVSWILFSRADFITLLVFLVISTGTAISRLR